MVRPDVITVDWHDLGIAAGAAPFATGAVGELFHIPNQVAGLSQRKLVFKRVKSTLEAGVDRHRVLAQMRSVVSFRDTLSAGEIDDLDDVTVWPLAMVVQGGNDVGVIIELIIDDFFVNAKPPDRPLFELQFLCVSANYFRARGIDPKVTGDNVMRLALAARLAYAIEVVHRHPVVFGDLHLKNAVAATRPRARVLLMDCDGIAELSDQHRLQLHGIGFKPPEIHNHQQKLQDQVTDVYKLGLCIIKALSPGTGATQATDPAKTVPGTLDTEGLALLRRAVSATRSDRPKAWEIRDYLVRRVKGMIQLPELLSAELSQRVVLRGSDLFVRWQQRHGTEVRIYGTNGFVLEGIDPAKHAGGLAIRPPTAGPIDVEVWNQHGPSERVTAGQFDYYELPALDITGQLRGIMRAPVPEVPALEAGMFDTLQPYPMISTPELAIEVSGPKLEYPALTIDLDQSSAGSKGSPGKMIANIQRTANELLGKTVSDAVSRMNAAMLERLEEDQARGKNTLPQGHPRSAHPALVPGASFAKDWKMQNSNQRTFGTLLARLGGADVGVLSLAPKARREYIALALVLLATSGIAVASMTFAMADGLKIHPGIAVAIGLFWGAVILAIDRALIISLKPKGGSWRTFWMVLPRIVMAGLLGLVISTPLTLRIFSDEIQEQMTRDQIATANAAAQQLADGDLKRLLESKEAEVKKYEDVLAGNLAYTSPGLAQAKQEHEAAEADYQTKQRAAEDAYRKWQCELYGVGCESTSGHRGNGPLAHALEKEYRNRLAEAQQAKSIVDAKQAALLQAQEQNATAAGEALTTAKTEANTQLAVLRPQRDALRRQMQDLNDNAQGQRQEGLLAQLVALGHLGESDGLARLAHLLVAALLFMIELLPVAIKTLTLLGPTTLYERADKFDDDRILKLAAAKAKREHLKQDELDRLAIESERRVAVKVTERVEEVVTDLAMGAVERWSQQTRQAAAAYIQRAPTMELPQACAQCGLPRTNGHVCSGSSGQPSGGHLNGGQSGGGQSGGGRHLAGGSQQPWSPRTAPQQAGPYNLPPGGNNSGGKHGSSSGDATP